MNVLSSLLGRRPSRERPDLAAWIADASPALVVDGDGSGASYPGAHVLVHATHGVPGLPFHFPDPRRLPFAAGEFKAVVLADVMDQVIDTGAALDEARRVLAKGGLLLVAQTIAPEDFEERAIWNAVAGMRDRRHTTTPSPRQFAAMISGLEMETVKDAAWEETCAATAKSRPDCAERLALLVAAAAARGAQGVVRDGALVLARRASLLRRN